MATRPRYRESRRKPLGDLKRPRRRLGDELRPVLTCPLCVSPRVDVLRWGEKTTRFVCDSCGVRFSLDLHQLAQTLIEPKHPGMFEEGLAEGPFFHPRSDKTRYLAGGAAEDLGAFIDRARQMKPPTAGQPPRRPSGDGSA